MRVLLALPEGGGGDAAVAEGLARAVRAAHHEIVDGPHPAPSATVDTARSRVEFERAFFLLQQADALVADVSVPSTSVGWMIAWFLSRGRLVVLTVRADERSRLTPFVLGNPNPWQRIVAYSDLASLEREITQIFSR